MAELPTCYFAHHVPEYGSEREALAIATIEAAGFIVDNPNALEHQEGYAREGMNYFLGRVAACDALALQRFSTGEIGAGVAKEIQKAVDTGMPTYEVTSSGLLLVDGTMLAGEALSVDETRALIQRMRAKNATA